MVVVVSGGNTHHDRALPQLSALSSKQMCFAASQALGITTLGG
jgi:hypothetical protein